MLKKKTLALKSHAFETADIKNNVVQSTCIFSNYYDKNLLC